MDHRQVLIEYLKVMLEREDWHGVRDAAADLEIVDAVRKVKGELTDV